MSDARATWTMPPAIIEQAEGRWPKIDKAIRAGIIAGEIILQSKLKADILSGQEVARRSGNLSRGVFMDPTTPDAIDPYHGFVGIGPEVPYAAYINYGTGIFHAPDAHSSWTQEAEPGSALRFEAGGEEIYARRIVHEGIEPRYFMELALADSRQRIIDGIETRVVDAVAE